MANATPTTISTRQAIRSRQFKIEGGVMLAICLVLAVASGFSFFALSGSIGGAVIAAVVFFSFFTPCMMYSMAMIVRQDLAKSAR